VDDKTAASVDPPLAEFRTIDGDVRQAIIVEIAGHREGAEALWNRLTRYRQYSDGNRDDYASLVPRISAELSE